MLFLFAIFAPLVLSFILLLIKKIKLIENLTLAASILTFFGALAGIKTALTGAAINSKLALLFVPDKISALLGITIATVGLAAAVYSVGYLRYELKHGAVTEKNIKQYFILFNLFLAAMFAAIFSANPILTWIFVEATTLSTVFLVNFYRKSGSLEAAWKYLLINSMGLLLGFFGTVLLSAPVIELGEDLVWKNVLANLGALDPLVLKMAFGFVLIGYGTKAGLAPMHTWLPDAHSKAPAPISALFSGVLLNVALFAVWRYVPGVNLALNSNFANQLLLALGFLSILIAAPIIFGQNNYKRLLAYSSIEHMGIIALGFGAGSLFAFWHIIYHALAKSALFLCSGNIFLQFGSTKISNIKNLLKQMPVTAVLFLLGVLAIAGMPPFGLFFTELHILKDLMANYLSLAIIVFLALILAFVGFLAKSSAMLYGEENKAKEIKKIKLGWQLILPPAVLLFILLILTFYQPAFLLNLIQ